MLFDDYQDDALPVNDTDTTVIVQLGMSLLCVRPTDRTNEFSVNVVEKIVS